jgi:hypothetical protein
MLTAVAGWLTLDQIDHTRSVAAKIREVHQLLDEAGEIARLKTIGDGVAFITQKLQGANHVQ